MKKHLLAGSAKLQPLLILILSSVIVLLGAQKSPTAAIRGVTLQGEQRLQQDYDKSRLRISLYNIHSSKGSDGKRSLSRIADVLRNSNADLISLHEVNYDFLQDASQAELLAETLDMAWLFAPTRRKDFVAGFGNALLSKRGVSNYQIEPLVLERRTSEGVLRSHAHRNLIKTQLQLGSQTVTIISTHLDRGPLRLEQLQDVLLEFQQHSPAILIGDLNSTRDDAPLKNLLDRQLASDAIARVIKTDYDDRIDWILSRGLKVHDGGMIDSAASDHPHFWVDFSASL